MSVRKEIRRIAYERVRKLLKLAREKRRRRYVYLAMRIARKHRIRVKDKFFCPKCFVLWGTETLKVRTTQNGVLYECKVCGFKRVYPWG